MDVLGPSWLQDGGLGTIFAPSWEVLGSYWLQLGRSWHHFASNVGPSWLQVGDLEDILAPRYLGAKIKPSDDCDVFFETSLLMTIVAVRAVEILIGA